MPKQTQFLTRKEAAELLTEITGVRTKTSTVSQFCNNGKLRHIKYGGQFLIYRDAIDAFLQSLEPEICRTSQTQSAQKNSEDAGYLNTTKKASIKTQGLTSIVADTWKQSKKTAAANQGLKQNISHYALETL